MTGPARLPPIPDHLLTTTMRVLQLTLAKTSTGGRTKAASLVAEDVPAYLYAPGVAIVQRQFGLAVQATYVAIIRVEDLDPALLEDTTRPYALIAQDGPHSGLRFRMEGKNVKQRHHLELALAQTPERYTT